MLDYCRAKVLDTLAAAYTAAGQLTQAVEAAQRAIAAARNSGQTNLLESLEARGKRLAREGERPREP